MNANFRNQGWEKKWMPERNCYVYLDHKNKRTTWTPPESARRQ